MALFDDLREITDPLVDKTESEIAADTNVRWILAALLGDDTQVRDVRLSNTQLVNILNNIGGLGSQIAASSETLLSNAGDFFDFDVSALTPPVSGREVIPVVLEKGTAGGELFAQELEFDQNYPLVAVQGNWFFSVYVEETDTIYYAPYSDEFFLKASPTAKTSNRIGSTFGTTVAKNVNPVYDPTTRKIFSTNNNGLNIAVLNIDDETTTSIAVATEHWGCVRGSDGFIYILEIESGDGNSILRKIDPSTSIVTDVATLTGSGSGFDFYDIIQVGDYIYTASYGDTTRKISRIDITAVTPTWSTFVSGINTGAFITPINLGQKIYWAGGFTGAEIMILDIDLGTVSYINTGQIGYQGTAILNDNIYFFPRSAVGVFELNPSDNSTRTLGTKTNFTSAIVVDENIFLAPGFGTRITEFDFTEPFNFDPSNPSPFFSVTNLFDTSGNVNRLASLEDYNVDFTEDGGGNITNIRVTMLTEGAKNVTLNLVYSGF